jgi:guanylate kinase
VKRVDATSGRGILFVLSAASGTGKTTLAEGLRARDPGLDLSISYTTRPWREGERDGREYHFVGDARFDAMIAGGELLEWAEVFGRRYGTGREATERVLLSGRDLMLVIDVQGARQVRASGVPAVLVFLLPPSFGMLESRLRGRKSEAEADLARRLRVARQEVEEYSRYDYLLVNDDLERAVEDLRSVVRAERLRVPRREAEAQRIVRTFPTRSGSVGGN